ncbi:MAG: PAS domain S-box protein [Chloroflexota bacterium]|nr:MAG: PAS domain S-box protein [Chloroflexota bacterium]
MRTPEDKSREGLARKDALYEELERRSQVMDAILSSTPDHLYLYDLAGRYIYASVAGAKALGMQPSEMIGKTWRELGLPAEIMEPFEAKVKTISATGESVTGETQFPTVEGVRDYEYILTPVFDSAGGIASVLATVRDITEQKRAEMEHEHATRQAEMERALLEAVVNYTPAGILVARGSDLTVQMVNPAYQAMYPGIEILGRTMADIWPAAYLSAAHVITRVLETGEPYKGLDDKFILKRSPDGPMETGYFTWTLTRVRLPDEDAWGLLSTAMETTERIRAMEEQERLLEQLQDSNEKLQAKSEEIQEKNAELRVHNEALTVAYRNTAEARTEAWKRAAQLTAVIDNMVDGVFVCDAEGRMTLVNDAGLRLLGLERIEDAQQALIGAPELLRIRHLDGQPIPPAELAMSRALNGYTVMQQECLVYNALRQRDIYIRISASSIRNHNGEILGAVAVARDVTEAIELDKMKDSFIAVAAHELKTPVAIMKGYSQALLRPRKGVSSRQYEMLEAIDRGSNRINAIVQDLLDISQLHIGRLKLTTEVIDLSALVAQTAERMSRTTDKHCIRFQSPGSVTIKGDSGRVEQVLVNFIDNAIKFSPTGGDIDLTVAVQGREAIVTVRDHGVGIPKEKQSRIFQRFYRAHDGTPYDYGGMGVGLYISKEIVERHRGRIWFESEDGKGSTFFFGLPLP